MRFRATCYRAHDPRWSFKPLSGEGAAVHGGRFNPKGMPALYLALSIDTAIKEANRGFAFKINPCVLCSYEFDCEDMADLRTDAGLAEHGIAPADLSCAWLSDALESREPASWRVTRRLVSRGIAGLLVASFAPGATPNDQNLILWKWGAKPPHQVAVHDPSGRLPHNQLSWE